MKVNDIVVYKATNMGTANLGIRKGIIIDIFKVRHTVYHIKDLETNRIVTRRFEVMPIKEFIQWLNS